MKTAIGAILLSATLLVGCATHKTGSLVVVRIQHDGLAETVVANVASNGSFHKEVTNGRSTIVISGQVAEKEGNSRQVTIDYQCTTEKEVGGIKKKVIHTALSLPQNGMAILEQGDGVTEINPATAAVVLTLNEGESSNLTSYGTSLKRRP